MFGRTHPRFTSPHVAIAALGVLRAGVFVFGLAWQGPTLIDAVTYLSWLLQVGATGILPVYAAVGVAGAVSRLAAAEAPLIATSRPARRGRDGCGRGDGVLRAATGSSAGRRT
jgi:amino acid transporter